MDGRQTPEPPTIPVAHFSLWQCAFKGKEANQVNFTL